MQWMTRWVLATALFVGGPAWASEAETGDAPRWQSRTEVETHARDLDHRVIALQHELLAARHTGDQAAIERAEADLKNVQAERLAVLRMLGELR